MTKAQMETKLNGEIAELDAMMDVKAILDAMMDVKAIKIENKKDETTREMLMDSWENLKWRKHEAYVIRKELFGY